MKETVVTKKALPELLMKIIPTEKVRVNEEDGVIHVVPISDDFDYTFGLRGILSQYDAMSVDNFLKRKRADSAMDL